MLYAANPAEDLIDSEFPEIYRHLIEPALRRAYAAADMVMDREEFLSTPSAAVQRGDLIMLAAEHQFHKLVRDNFLPFDASWDDHAAPTGKHLVLRSPGALITINQVEFPGKKPRYAAFRDTYAAQNTAYLFEEWNEEVARDDRRGHILLLHGYGSLRFCNLAVPHPTQSRLIWKTPSLLAIDHVDDSATTSGGEGPAESPDAEIDEDVVEHVLRDLRDSRG